MKAIKRILVMSWVVLIFGCKSVQPAVTINPKEAIKGYTQTTSQSQVKKTLSLVKIIKSVFETEEEYVAKRAWIPTQLALSTKGTVSIAFGKSKDGVSSNQRVHPDLVAALSKMIGLANKNLSQYNKIRTIYVSSTTNGKHARESNHYIATAIDISRINGVKMRFLGVNSQVKQMQLALTKLSNVRENFGPYLKVKTLKDGITSSVWVKGHYDHIHFSVQSPLNGEL